MTPPLQPGMTSLKGTLLSSALTSPQLNQNTSPPSSSSSSSCFARKVKSNSNDCSKETATTCDGSPDMLIATHVGHPTTSGKPSISGPVSTNTSSKMVHCSSLRLAPMSMVEDQNEHSPSSGTQGEANTQYVPGAHSPLPLPRSRLNQNMANLVHRQSSIDQSPFDLPSVVPPPPFRPGFATDTSSAQPPSNGNGHILGSGNGSFPSNGGFSAGSSTGGFQNGSFQRSSSSLRNSNVGLNASLEQFTFAPMCPSCRHYERVAAEWQRRFFDSEEQLEKAKRLLNIQLRQNKDLVQMQKAMKRELISLRREKKADNADGGIDIADGRSDGRVDLSYAGEKADVSYAESSAESRRNRASKSDFKSFSEPRRKSCPGTLGPGCPFLRDKGKAVAVSNEARSVGDSRSGVGTPGGKFSMIDGSHHGSEIGERNMDRACQYLCNVVDALVGLVAQQGQKMDNERLNAVLTNTNRLLETRTRGDQNDLKDLSTDNMNPVRSPTESSDKTKKSDMKVTNLVPLVTSLAQETQVLKDPRRENSNSSTLSKYALEKNDEESDVRDDELEAASEAGHNQGPKVQQGLIPHDLMQEPAESVILSESFLKTPELKPMEIPVRRVGLKNMSKINLENVRGNEHVRPSDKFSSVLINSLPGSSPPTKKSEPSSTPAAAHQQEGPRSFSSLQTIGNKYRQEKVTEIAARHWISTDENTNPNVNVGAEQSTTNPGDNEKSISNLGDEIKNLGNDLKTPEMLALFQQPARVEKNVPQKKALEKNILDLSLSSPPLASPSPRGVSPTGSSKGSASMSATMSGKRKKREIFSVDSLAIRESFDDQKADNSGSGLSGILDEQRLGLKNTWSSVTKTSLERDVEELERILAEKRAMRTPPTGRSVASTVNIL